MKLSNVFLGDKTHYRVAAGVSSWLTLAWFMLGVAVWPATMPPSWYLLVLCAGFGLVFWFTTGWIGLH